MADVHDVTRAGRATDDARETLRAFCSRVEDGGYAESEDAMAVVLVLGLGFSLLAAAIREAATRADYIAWELRDSGRKA